MYPVFQDLSSLAAYFECLTIYQPPNHFSIMELAIIAIVFFVVFVITANWLRTVFSAPHRLDAKIYYEKEARRQRKYERRNRRFQRRNRNRFGEHQQHQYGQLHQNHQYGQHAQHDEGHFYDHQQIEGRAGPPRPIDEYDDSRYRRDDRRRKNRRNKSRYRN